MYENEFNKEFNEINKAKKTLKEKNGRKAERKKLRNSFVVVFFIKKLRVFALMGFAFGNSYFQQFIRLSLARVSILFLLFR